MPKTDETFDPRGYATVAQRIALFYGSHPTGRIQTELINRDECSVTFKASVYRSEGDPVPAATGWATEREGDGDINTVACLENTETSAIGRALANLGFTAARERPSVEEMRKAARARQNRARVRERAPDGVPVQSLPEHAHAVADLLTLLADAERAGLSPDRATRLRTTLESGAPTSVERIRELERSLRGWLGKRGDRGDGDHRDSR